MRQKSSGMSIAHAAAFAVSHGLAAEVEAIRQRRAHPRLRDKYEGFRKGHLLKLLEKHDLLDRFIAERWPTGATTLGARKQAGYHRRREKNDRLWATDPRPDPERAYPLESVVRDALAQKLDDIEDGLRLFREGARTGIEYVIDAAQGRIDILALDIHDVPLVIELKRTRGRRGALGQLLYYMAWVDRHLGHGRSRGAIVAAQITGELLLAAERSTDVSLFEYEYDGTLRLRRVPTAETQQDEAS